MKEQSYIPDLCVGEIDALLKAGDVNIVLLRVQIAPGMTWRYPIDPHMIRQMLIMNDEDTVLNAELIGTMLVLGPKPNKRSMRDETW